MTQFRNRYRVESSRLKGWDYRDPGYYFVTICTRGRRAFFGEVMDGAVCLSPIGLIAASEWAKTPTVRLNVQLDAWIIMPDHLHGIVVITSNPEELPVPETRTISRTRDDSFSQGAVGLPHRDATKESSRLLAGSLGAIIGQFKATSTKRIRQAGYADFGWQSRFYDRIIRDKAALNRVRRYIEQNAKKWDADRRNPAGPFM